MSERPNCPGCGKPAQKNGIEKNGKQKWACKRADCGYGGFYEDYTISSLTNKGVSKPIESTPKTGLSEQQLRAKHDMTYIVKQAVAQLKKGVFLTDSEFIQKSGLKASAGYRQVLDHPDFDNYKGRAGGKIYWSHPDSIKKMIEDSVLNSL